MKFTKSEMKKSLRDGISLMVGPNNELVWATFEEISVFTKTGYELINEKKRALYDKSASKLLGKSKNRRR